MPQEKTTKGGGPEKFGERAVRLGLVTTEQVARALERQKNLRHRKKAHKLTGIILLEQGAITNNQLIDILQTYEDESDHPVL